MNKYYVYYYTQAVYKHAATFETKDEAENKVAELQIKGEYEQVLYTINFVIRGAFY